VRRISLTLPDEVYNALEELAERMKIDNRSRLVADMIMAHAMSVLEDEKRYAGSVVVLYDHSRGETVYALTDVQHDYPEVSATIHMHISEDLCAEVLGVRGEGKRLRSLLSRLREVSGVITVQHALIPL
jgi:CopG family nickel-responsive transcriptional regulator